MGNILALTGRRYNALETGTVTVASEDPFYPKSRLWEARPIQPYKSTGTVDQFVEIDGNRIVNGHFNDWSAGAPTGWTVIGTVAETTTAGQVRSGSAARINGGNSSIHKDITVRAGERVNLNGWRRILAAGQGSFVGELQNRTTGKHWNGSTWQAAPTSFLNDSANAAYTQYGPTALTVEAYSVVQADTCDLRLTLRNADATATDYVFVDDWFMWPSIDFCGVVGNNISPGVTVELRSSNSGLPAGTLRRNLTTDVKRPVFYHQLASTIDDRFWGVYFDDDNYVPYVIGDIILGKALALSRMMSDAGYELQWIFDVIETMSEAGDHQAVSRSDEPRQVLGMEFDFTSHAEMEEPRDEVFRRSLGSARPVVIVPDSDRPDVVLGKIDRSFKVRRLLETLYGENALYVSGLPFPLVTA